MSLTKVNSVCALITFVFLVDFAFVEGCDPVALAHKWAPKIYLNSKEEYWPGDVEVFLEHVQVKGKDCPKTSEIPTGPDSQKCFLTTNGDPNDLIKEEDSYLLGVKPGSHKWQLDPVPAYVNVKPCGNGRMIISYWIFFPFNKGKQMCKLEDGCGTVQTVVGNHVGDFEHLSLEMQGELPVSLFLAVHDGGIFYDYDKGSNTFTLSSQLKNGILKVPDPPQTIQLVGTHPVLYCALGSHAVWSAPGTFSFSRVELDQLVDETDQGREWNTWEALKVFYSKETTPAWWYYEGRWGNQASQCILRLYCLFSAGPRGLSTRSEEYTC
ncbi:uncharacterized protein LOC128987390 [Macrosteles quadrilineatus]|uniref:uncharacterized protein LOC128987390 n=1 Tax=Macrosteles quadrilineatus TaxID=74068 RepID=UPI0023E2F638|nr:uncharacterized protein LOC128987390 [Macrosteles quadrilineatus]